MPTELESTIRSLVDAGKGWVNLRPEVAEDDQPPVPSGLSRLLSGRGPAVPLATFVVGSKGKPHLVGIEHGSGPKARQRLGELGIRAPVGSNVKSDHGKRGLVVSMAPDVDEREVVRFLFEAATELSVVPIGQVWEAEIYTG